MSTIRARLTALFTVLLLAFAAGGCDALRDTEPFTVTIAYEQQQSRLLVTPLSFTADNSFGQVQIDNQTDVERGFAIDELAVYEKIPARQVRTVQVDEAKDGRTYLFYDHLHPDQFRGTMRVKYKAESER